MIIKVESQVVKKLFCKVVCITLASSVKGIFRISDGKSERKKERKKERQRKERKGGREERKK